MPRCTVRIFPLTSMGFDCRYPKPDGGVPPGYVYKSSFVFTIEGGARPRAARAGGSDGRDRAAETKKASLSLAFFLFRLLKFPQVDLLNLLNSSESEPEILVGGASFELATPAV